MVEAFRHRRQPMETFHDGVAVAEMLMALYRSAEIGQTVRLPAPELEAYVPPWRARERSRCFAPGGSFHYASAAFARKRKSWR